MATKTFLDTNVLIYSVDGAFPEKQKTSLELISSHARNQTGVISTQVLQEFYSAATRKLAIEPLKAKQLVRHFRIFDIIQVTPAMIESGIDCSILNQLSFWDGLIVEAASAAGCAAMLSEDLTDGQVICGVRICNPFES
jgi:predicted nucleic acid-binding protein